LRGDCGGIASPKRRHSLEIPIAIGIRIRIEIEIGTGIGIAIGVKGIAGTEERREARLSVDGL